MRYTQKLRARLLYHQLHLLFFGFQYIEGFFFLSLVPSGYVGSSTLSKFCSTGQVEKEQCTQWSNSIIHLIAQTLDVSTEKEGKYCKREKVHHGLSKSLETHDYRARGTIKKITH